MVWRRELITKSYAHTINGGNEKIDVLSTRAIDLDNVYKKIKKRKNRCCARDNSPNFSSHNVYLVNIIGGCGYLYNHTGKDNPRANDGLL